MLTHSNLLYTVAGTLLSINQMGAEFGEEFTPDDTMLSYLPLAHIFDRSVSPLPNPPAFCCPLLFLSTPFPSCTRRFEFFRPPPPFSPLSTLRGWFRM